MYLNKHFVNMFPKHHVVKHFPSSIARLTILIGILSMLPRTFAQTKPPEMHEPTEEMQCRIDSLSQDYCTFVRRYCSDFDEDGLIPFLQIYYCSSAATRPYVLTGMLLWLMVLFSSMAITAGDFLSVHLAIIVHCLSISESLAGVTIFAFGNGSSDFFSTLAAMDSGSGSLAIGELFGAAAFITTVVFGLITIIHPFLVDPHTFIPEVVWFMIAATVLTVFLADGELVMGECLGIIGLYIAFISFAVLWTRRRAPPTKAVTHSDGSEEQIGDVTAEHLSDHFDEAEGSSAHKNLSGGSTDVDARLHLGDEWQGQDAEARLKPACQQTNTESNRGETTPLLSPTSSQYRPGPAHQLDGLQQSSFLKMLPPFATWNQQNLGEKIVTTFSLPFLLLIGITTPMVPPVKEDKQALNEEIISQTDDNVDGLANSSFRATAGAFALSQYLRFSWLRILAQNWTLGVQLIFGPQFFTLVLLFRTFRPELSTPTLLFILLIPLILSVILVFCFIATYRSPRSRLTIASHLLISTTAFVISLMWIFLMATSAVALLRTLGVILRIPAAILGATVFAIGNSSNDLAANIAVARKGFPVLAASACFGGPMMNMLLGIGCGGLVQVLKGHGNDNKIGARSYSFDISPAFFMSASSLLLGLAVMLGYAYYASWKLDQRLGFVLIGVWSVFTVGTIVMNTAGI